MAERLPQITLSSTQAAQVMEAMSEYTSLASLLLNGIGDPKTLMSARDPRFSLSLIRGLAILASLPRDGSSMGLIELSRLLEVSPSTTHRYLLTLVEVGLIERDEKTRRYRIATQFVATDAQDADV